MQQARSAHFVVSAYGTSAAGQAPRFTLLLDGQPIGSATVNALAATDYSFDANVLPGAGHRVEVVFENDGVAPGEDRNLFLNSVSIDGQVASARSAMEVYHAPGQGDIVGSGALYWGGTAEFNLPASYFPMGATPPAAPALPPAAPAPVTPATPTIPTVATVVPPAAPSLPAAPAPGTPPTPTAGTIGVTAYGIGDGGFPSMTLIVDGSPVGARTVTADSATYTFDARLTPGVPHEIQVAFYNTNGQRALMLQSITVGGTTLLATGPEETYTSRVGTVAGSGDMRYGGFASFRLAASFAATPPAPVIPPSVTQATPPVPQPVPTPSPTEPPVVMRAPPPAPVPTLDPVPSITPPVTPTLVPTSIAPTPPAPTVTPAPSEPPATPTVPTVATVVPPAAPSLPAAPAPGTPPAPTAGTIGVTAYGIADGGFPAMTLVVDGSPVGARTVTANSATYTFDARLTPGVPHEIQVAFYNTNGQRALMLQSITVGGTTLLATGPEETYTSRVGTIAGSGDMRYGGFASFRLPASFAATPPAPAPTAPPVVMQATPPAPTPAPDTPPSVPQAMPPVPQPAPAPAAPPVVMQATPPAPTPAPDTPPSVPQSMPPVPQPAPGPAAPPVVMQATPPAPTPAPDAPPSVPQSMPPVPQPAPVPAAPPVVMQATPPAPAPVPTATPPQAGPGYYVAPNGSDANDGSAALPFATLARAKAAMEGSAVRTTYLESGTYALSSTLVLGAADSGMSFVAAAGARPVLDGGSAGLSTLVAVQDAHAVTISGIGFTNATRSGGAALSLRNTTASTLVGNMFSRTDIAVLLTGSSGNTVSGNQITDTAQSAVEVKDGSNYNTFDSNLVRGVGGYATYGGAFFLHGANYNTISHNKIENTAGMGIGINNWDDTVINIGNTVAYNLIRNVNMSSVDSGAIYVLGRSHRDTQTVIRNNLIDGTGGSGATHTIGIYLDDSASGVLVQDNIVRNVGTHAVQVHGGDDNKIRNNIFDLGARANSAVLFQSAPADTRPRNSQLGNEVSGNIILAAAAGQSPYTSLDGGNPTISGNIYRNSSGPVQAPSAPTADTNANFGDPNFANAAGGDYTLQPGSAAGQIGFRQIDQSQIGLLPATPHWYPLP